MGVQRTFSFFKQAVLTLLLCVSHGWCKAEYKNRVSTGDGVAVRSVQKSPNGKETELKDKGIFPLELRKYYSQECDACCIFQ